jgi:hypothetical protein
LYFFLFLFFGSTAVQLVEQELKVYISSTPVFGGVRVAESLF